MKKCTKCEKEAKARGLCSAHYSAEWRVKNPKRYRELANNHYKKNKEKIIKYATNWNKENSEQANATHRKWVKKTNYYGKRYHSDPEFRLRVILRNRLLQSIKTDAKSGSAVQDLGCKMVEFKDYIASKFKIGMTWDNYDQWQLDHIEPLCKFDLSDRNQFLKACHYTNLQPLWIDEHRFKTKNDLSNA